MNAFFNSLKILFVVGFLTAIYLFRFADKPVTFINDNTGLIVFGYDKKQNRWLINEHKQYNLGVDGPYVFYKRDGSAEVIYVNERKDSFYITKNNRQLTYRDSLMCHVDDPAAPSFAFRPKESLTSPPFVYDAPDTLLALSDIEGNFQAFTQLLTGNAVINQNLNWTFGTGHLVLVGDFMDRGINVTQCLWLIYKLEDEALTAGGRVHFILGNHEQLNLQGVVKYVDPKYRELCRRLGISHAALFDRNTELGRWLRTKNVVEKIGDNLYLHGGISPEVASKQFSLDEINRLARADIDRKSEEIDNQHSQLLLGPMGVLWYRGLVQNYKNYSKLEPTALERILSAFNAKRIFVGHTLVEQVSTDFNGRVVRLDVDHVFHSPEAVMIRDSLLLRAGKNGATEKL